MKRIAGNFPGYGECGKFRPPYLVVAVVVALTDERKVSRIFDLVVSSRKG